MAQYIDKSVLVAEINQRIEDYKSHKIDDSYYNGLIFALEDLRDDFINTLEVKEVEEEPVSEDLEDAVNAYMGHKPDVDESSSVYGKRQAFKAGAKWQKEQMMKDAIDVEVKVDAGGYPYIDRTIELYDYDKDVPLAKAGEKVKVIIMKENELLQEERD